MRAILAIAFMLAALLAGCSGDSASDPVTPSPPPAVPPASLEVGEVAFSLPVVLGTVGGGAEPSVAIAADGTVYVTTPLALWRSDDGGKTFQGIGTPTCSISPAPCVLPQFVEAPAPDTLRGGGDTDLWVAPDGRVHWLGLFDGDNAIPYQVSEDLGETWSEVVDLAGEDSGDREWINGRADGTLFASWRNFPQDGDAKIRVSRSWDGGATWQGPFDVANDTRQGGVVVDPSSHALALAYDMNGPLHVARSADNGTTWESVQVADGAVLGHVFPVLAFDTNGTLYLVSARDTDGADVPSMGTSNRPLEHPNLYLWVSHDKGATWSDAVQVNEPGTTAWFPWLAAGGPGRLVVTWYQNDEGLPRGVGGDVFVMAGISLDADRGTPTFTRARASPDPIHTGPECREQPQCQRSLLDFFEVAIHPDGYPVVAWAQDTYPVDRIEVASSIMTQGPDLWEGGAFHT